MFFFRTPKEWITIIIFLFYFKFYFYVSVSSHRSPFGKCHQHVCVCLDMVNSRGSVASGWPLFLSVYPGKCPVLFLFVPLRGEKTFWGGWKIFKNKKETGFLLLKKPSQAKTSNVKKEFSFFYFPGLYSDIQTNDQSFDGTFYKWRRSQTTVAGSLNQTSSECVGTSTTNAFSPFSK